MAMLENRYQLVYVNPDGTLTESPLAAHWDAEPFLLDLQMGIIVEMEKR